MYYLLSHQYDLLRFICLGGPQSEQIDPRTLRPAGRIATIPRQPVPARGEFPILEHDQSPAGYVVSGKAIHPAHLYSSFYGIVIHVALLVLERKRSFDGFTFAFLCIFYGAARFAIDFFRYYEETAIMGGLTYNQMISIGLSALGFILLLYLPRRLTR